MPPSRPRTAAAGTAAAGTGDAGTADAGGAAAPGDAAALELAALVTALGAAAGYREALSCVARCLVPRVVDWCTIHVRDEAGIPRLRAAAHRDATQAQALRQSLRDAAHARGPVAPGRGGGLVDRVLATGATVHIPDVAPSMLASIAGADASADVLAAAGTRAVVAVPLALHEPAPAARDARPDARPDAVIVCATGESGRPLDARVARLVEQCAAVAAVLVRGVVRLDAEQQAHADAEAARQQVTAALEAMGEGFMTVDRGWRVTYANAAAAALWRQPRGALVGADLRALDGGRYAAALAPCEAVMQSGGNATFELHEPALDSWLEVRAFPTPQGLSVHLRDVTAHHRAEQTRAELLARAIDARAEAVAANQAKADFLASMSHELRTPLNAILGYVSLLADGITGPVSAAQVQQLSRIAASSRHLLALIEEILAFARLESGEERTYVEEGEAGALARDAGSLIEPVIETQGLRFVVEIPDAPIPMQTDVRKVRQILLNLLANAARFTPAGGVVELRVAAVGADGVAFAVHDTGIGIAPEHHERVFEPFWQVEQSRTRRVGGTGLGLSVSRRYARLLGGDVALESAPRSGSTFTLRLPRRPASDRDATD